MLPPKNHSTCMNFPIILLYVGGMCVPRLHIGENWFQLAIIARKTIRFQSTYQIYINPFRWVNWWKYLHVDKKMVPMLPQNIKTLLLHLTWTPCPEIKVDSIQKYLLAGMDNNFNITLMGGWVVPGVLWSPHIALLTGDSLSCTDVHHIVLCIKR